MRNLNLIALTHTYTDDDGHKIVSILVANLLLGPMNVGFLGGCITEGMEPLIESFMVN